MHSLLDTYLADVAARLGALPPRRRDDELREMRAHLEAAVAAGREDGLSEDAAAASALAQFGPPPHEAAAGIVRAWKRARNGRNVQLAGAGAITLALTMLLPWLLFPLEKPLVMRAFQSHDQWIGLLVLFWQTPPFLVAGAVSGFAFPRRAVAGTGLAVAAYELFYVVRYALSAWAVPAAHPVIAVASHATVVRIEPVSFALFCTAYLLSAIFGAWAGSRWRWSRTAVAAR